jgi:hypothetical protein
VKRILIRFFKDTISLEISDLNLNEKKLNSDYQLNEQSPLILNHWTQKRQQHITSESKS